MQGFLTFSRGTLILDIIAIGMLAVVPILLWSVKLVRKDKDYESHRKIQTSLTALLAVLVVCFEVELKMVDWRNGAKLSPYYDTFVKPVLSIHLFFAISTALLWAVTFLSAWKFFSKPAAPNKFSKKHRILGRLTVIDTTCTGITGWIFYYLAFIAS